MKSNTFLIALALLAFTYVGCSKHAPETNIATEIKPGTEVDTNHNRLVQTITRTNGLPQTNDIPY